MIKEDPVSTQLGITQQELAMLIGVTRSQIAMYETKKRSLPVAAFKKLSDLLAYKNNPKVSARSKSNFKQQPEAQKYLEKKLSDNEFTQLIVERKIAVIKKQEESAIKILQLSGFLEQQAVAGKATTPGIDSTILRKASKADKQDKSFELFKLELKLELLQSEKQIVSKILKNIFLKNSTNV